MTSTREWLEQELRKAILMACTKDEVLFGRDACERSIMFRIGHYLASAVEERYRDRMWVDLEYNRIASDEEAKVKKEVSGLLDTPDIKRSVYPDLIVHDRNGSSEEHNILVVEAKKFPVGPHGATYDLRKLAAYKHDLHYQHAVYLELRELPWWQWIDEDDALRCVTGHPGDGLGDTASSADDRSDT